MRHRDGMYCVELHADDMHPMGRSIRYSAMVALGLLRARSAGIQVGSEPDDLTELLFSHIDDPALTPGDVGLLLWVDQRARRDRADHLLAALERSLQVSGGLAAREGMEVAWIAIAAAKCVEQGLRGPAERALASARAELHARPAVACCSIAQLDGVGVSPISRRRSTGYSHSPPSAASATSLRSRTPERSAMSSCVFSAPTAAGRGCSMPSAAVLQIRTRSMRCTRMRWRRWACSSFTR